ncbi:Ldh family oxidoreductase [Qiania dongpingensis]|uniref:Ldh family oxidoreductase n=1 Tax=Qiania dongpingensis TaxID=2763669 RepID=A0A7G9G230_9FIRM|nr:Ldh family oxidoreductase [Qiania dongpingensis]QNM04862.1 Ldh family oxidoreductase [Qiania dongpingensis]
MRIKVAELKEFCLDILTETGMPEDEAKILTETLLEADQRGVKSHGVMSLKRYVNLMQTGVMPKKLDYKVEVDNPVIAVWDGNRCCGQVLGHTAMKAAIEKAKTYGIGFVGVKNSNHFGAGAYYAQLAEKEGMIGISASTGDPTMAPWGGAEKMIGNNPLAISVPTKNVPPITLDMAQSVVAFGKIANMKRQGCKEVPAGWALDAEGMPTTDIEKVYSVMPLGGYKGFGLSLMVDVISGLLIGGGTGVRANPDQMGPAHTFIAIDTKAFGDTEQFLNRVDARVAEFKSCKKSANSTGIFMPGEIEEKCYAESQEAADIIPEIVDDLNALAEEMGRKVRLHEV